MAETQLDDPISRFRTPTPTLHFTQKPRLLLRQPSSEFLGSGLRDFAETYDSTILATPTIKSGIPDSSGGGTHRRSESMDADSRKGKPESSKSDHGRPAYHRRRSRSTAPQQQPNPHALPPSSSPGYGNTSSSTSENTHNHPPTDFRSSALSFPPAAVTYPQGSGFVGQYTIPSPPVPMNMSHSPSPYAFPHNFHHSVVPDSGMMSQNIHANYPPIVQPLPPVFSYQGQPPESITSSHPSFSGSRSPLYLPHQSHESSASTSNQPSTSAPITPNFVSSSPFHSLQYPSSMSIPAFRYPTPTYPPPSPMYQAQYPSPSFGQHYSPSAETEQQVAWYYFSHLASGPSPPQYDPGPSYQRGQYNIGYPHGGHTGVETSPFRDSPRHHSSPNQAGPSASHTMDSSPLFAQYAEDQPSSDSPSQSGSGPPHYHHGTATTAPAPSRVSSGSVRQAASERPPQRRSYHPNPPANRSEWVMWAGNVPSGATHDELWRFFTTPPDDQSGDTTNGVLSIFLIARSSCAFVNYHSEEDLQRAIARFDGVPLRSSDPRCPRLVCRVRGQGEDLKAGVGYQRGSGMHTKWLREQKGKEQKGKARETQTDSSEVSTSEVSTSDGQLSSPGSISRGLTHTMSAVSISSDDDNKHLHPTHSSSSGSYASTTSSFLSKYFPKRYFILKSLTQDDLDLSVERGVWATQKHNEEILDQAFRTSQEVYLIFGVNKSREFYGYARMRSLVRGGQQNVKWAARPVPPTGSVARPTHSSPPQTGQQSPFFSPSDGRLVEESPLPYTPSQTGTLQTGKAAGPSHSRHSAPALLGEEYHKPSKESPRKNLSLDHRPIVHHPSTGDEFELDASAPMRAMRANQGLPDGQESSGPSRAPVALHAVAEEGSEVPGSEEAVYDPNRPVIQQPEEVQRGEVSWGDSFAVEWISTTRFPFSQTRHLRNPWNRDKEIKVSRDGTELEPSVGERLLREWPQSAT